MRIKNLLISITFILFLMVTHSVWADECDNLLVHIHNNTKAPLFLLYNTYNTDSDITATRLIPASQTVTLDKFIQGPPWFLRTSYVEVVLQFVSLPAEDMKNYVYTVSKVEVWKYRGDTTTSGEIGSRINTANDEESYSIIKPFSKKTFGIDFPKEKIINGYCGVPSVAKPGEMTIEVTSPIIK